jgi:hypothetical protein
MWGCSLFRRISWTVVVNTRVVTYVVTTPVAVAALVVVGMQPGLALQHPVTVTRYITMTYIMTYVLKSPLC